MSIRARSTAALSALSLALTSPAQACWSCRAEVHSRVYADGFLLQLGTLSLPVVILLLAGLAVHWFGRRRTPSLRRSRP